jgi:hypothetical protein
LIEARRMAEISEQMYDKLLADFKTRLRTYVEAGEGSEKRLMREAEDMLGYRAQFPETWQKHHEVEGLIAEVIARRQQLRAFTGMSGEKSQDAPGCLIGWLFRRKAGGPWDN